MWTAWYDNYKKLIYFNTSKKTYETQSNIYNYLYPINRTYGNFKFIRAKKFRVSIPLFAVIFISVPGFDTRNEDVYSRMHYVKQDMNETLYFLLDW